MRIKNHLTNKNKREVILLNQFLKHELPLGFGMALAQNSQAMKIFADMSEGEQREVLEKAHHVNSKQEMQALVQSLI